MSSFSAYWIGLSLHYCSFYVCFMSFFFLLFFSIVDRTLLLPYFVARCCFCTSTLQTSVTLAFPRRLISAVINPVWDCRQRRGREGACVSSSFSTSAAPRWHRAIFRRPCSCRQPDADAVMCPRRSQTRDEDFTSTCQKECLLLEMCGKNTPVTSVFIFTIIPQR